MDLYWRAHIDANDVEFVLAPPRKSPTIPSQGYSAHYTTIESQTLGEHVVWILDFDCCTHMCMDKMDVEQAVVAFYKNDPFYPRPGRDDIKDQAIWNEFKDRFLKASGAILGKGCPEAPLPALWVDLVERRGQS